ncbi:MAG: OmpH family outer membrane protein [Woeseiaceae bacterium]|nr:OmpH family outer membrane protein [Woeseiaceae bacterium]
MTFLKQDLIKMIAAVTLLFAFALPATAQEMKIGVVNIPALMERIPQTKAALEALEEEFAPRQREFIAKQKEYTDLVEKVQKDAAVMGETERRNAETSLRELGRDVTRIESEFREDFNLRRNEELAKLQRSVLKEVTDFAQAEGYDLVVGDGVLFASAAVNITDEVLRAVEANYQATGSR